MHYSTCVSVPSPRKDCATSQAQKPWASKTLFDVCHTARSVISRYRQTFLTTLRKQKSLIGNHEAHEIQTTEARFGHNNTMQDHVLDLTWFLQINLRELMMKRQYKRQKRLDLPCHILEQMAPPDVPDDSVEPENSSRTMPTRRITFKRPPNPLDRCEPPEKNTRSNGDYDSALLSVYQHQLGTMFGNLNDDMGVFSGTRMPDMLGLLGLRSHPITINFLWMKKQNNKYAAIPIPRQPLTWWSNEDVQKRMCRHCQLNISVSWEKQKTKNSTHLRSTLRQWRHRVKDYRRLLCWKKKKTRSAVTLKDDGQIESTVGGAKCNWRKASRNANIKSNRIPSVTSDGPDTYCFTCFSYSQTKREMCVASKWFGRTSCGHQRRWRVISKLSQHNQFPTRSVNKFPSGHESCSWSTITVFTRWQQYTAWSMLQEDGITELPPIFETWEAKKPIMEPSLWTFRDENGIIQASWMMQIDDFILACSDSTFGKQIFDKINKLHEWTTWETRVYTQCGARITQNYDKHTKTWCGFEIYVHKVREKKSHSTTCHDMDVERENLSQLRALIGQLLWCAYAECATILGACVTVDGTSTGSHGGHDYDVINWLRKATVWANAPLKIDAHHSPWSPTQMQNGQPDELERHKEDSWSSSQTSSCFHVSHILPLDSSETFGKIVWCNRNSSNGRRQWRCCLHTVVLEWSSVWADWLAEQTHRNTT